MGQSLSQLKQQKPVTVWKLGLAVAVVGGICYMLKKSTKPKDEPRSYSPVSSYSGECGVCESIGYECSNCAWYYQMYDDETYFAIYGKCQPSHPKKQLQQPRRKRQPRKKR